MRAIPEEKRKQLLETCRQTSILLEEVQPVLMSWAAEMEKLEQPFIAALEKIKEKAKGFPRPWIPMTMGQIATGAALRGPARIEEYLSIKGRGLSAGAVTFLRSLMERPAFFTAFNIEKTLGDDLFQIRDYSSGKTHIVCSPALGDSLKSRPESYLTLLFSNGSCFQTIGPLHYFQGLASVDFHYYARLLQPDTYERSGLSAVMTSVPESFVILDAFAEIPAIGHKGLRLLGCWSTIPAASLDATALSSSFDREEAQGKMRFSLKGSNPPFATADLYWDPGKQEAFIYATSRQDYEKVTVALKGRLEAPPEPQVTVTGNMEVIARNLLGIEPPILAWERPFEPPPAGPEVEEQIGRLNALLQDLADATNHGRTYDLQKLAARHAVSMDTARQAEDMLKRQEQSMSIDVPGGLPGVRVLPPSGRMKMQIELATCGLFRFSTADEAQRLFKDLAPLVEAMRPRSQVSRMKTMLTLATLPSVLEEIDESPVDDGQHTVLKYTMYLLCRAGNGYHGTEDYAAEILRLFWQVLVPSRERPDIRRFIRQYAIWCRETLVRSGLAEEEAPEKAARPGEPFRLKATAFFQTWVRLGKTS